MSNDIIIYGAKTTIFGARREIFTVSPWKWLAKLNGLYFRLLGYGGIHYAYNDGDICVDGPGCAHGPVKWR